MSNLIELLNKVNHIIHMLFFGLVKRNINYSFYTTNLHLTISLGTVLGTKISSFYNSAILTYCEKRPYESTLWAHKPLDKPIGC
jgi:hypothetical protein